MKRKSDFDSYTKYALSQVELKRVLNACDTLSDYVMILLAARYGFRREDIVNVKVNNVDLNHSTITYHEYKKNQDRTIPIEPDVVQELRRYINTIPKDKRILGYLLPFRDGSTAWQHFQDVCKTADVPIPAGRTGRPFHALRGTCVKMRQAQGWTLNEVSALIGDEPETVAKHYATVTPSELATKMGVT
jgi:integrase